MSQGSNEYYNRAKNFLKVNPGMAVTVLTNPDPIDAEHQQRIMVDWFTYFAARDLHAVLENCDRILNGAGKAVTFPCDSPEMFDPSFVMPQHRWRRVVVDKGPQTRNIGEVLKATLESLKAAKPYGDPGRVRSPDEIADDGLMPQQRAEKWLAEYKNNPPPMPVFSDEFRRRGHAKPTKDAP